MKRLYFAAPLFCLSERSFNIALTKKIEAIGYQVFLPQRDGIEAQQLAFLGDEAWSQAIFDLDRKQIFASDVFLCVLDGRVPDEGMALELGLAFADRYHTARTRNLIGFSTDVRRFSRVKLNAMITGALDEVLEDEEGLLKRLKEVFETAA